MASVTAMAEAGDRIRINRAPVLTLWAAVVAERLGFNHATALILGQASGGGEVRALTGWQGAAPPRPITAEGVEIIHTKFGAFIRNPDNPGLVLYETPEALRHGNQRRQQWPRA
jgi:hypothetical protein